MAMAYAFRLALGAMLIAVWLTDHSPAAAQDVRSRPAVDEEHEESWYHQRPSYQPDPRAIIHEKAQARAAQRQARLASMSWYGMSNARPTASPTPFASLYSPTWQMPGSRPYVWYPADRVPSYVLYAR